MSYPPIDTAQMKEDYPIDVVAGRYVKMFKQGNHLRGPCPICGEGDDRFGIFPDDGTFACRRCHNKGDVFKLVMEVEDLDFVGAAKHLAGQEYEVKATNGKLESRSMDQDALSQESRHKWQEKLEIFSQMALRTLIDCKSEGPQLAMAWLANRGIDKKAIMNEGLGFNPRWRTVVDDIKLPPGLTIPRWSAHDVVVTAVNIYLTREAREQTGNQRMFVKGSCAKSFWMAMRIPDHDVLVITEGELDACLLNRFLPPQATSITTGGAQTIPDDLSILEGKRVILALDSDAAGADGVDRWRDRLPDATVATIPAGKDVTDYWKSGGKLDIWINEYL